LQLGKQVDKTVQMPLVVDMPAHGWYGGDAHQHIVHGEKEFAVNAHIASKIAQAEGADWCSFNGGWSSVPGENPSLEDMRASFQRESNPRFQAYLGEEYPKDHLGHMACLMGSVTNWHQQIGANAYAYDYDAGEHEAYAHFEILEALSEFDALSIYTHPTREWGGTPESPANIARELPFDLLAAPHLVPSIDWMTDHPHDTNAMHVWSMYLDWGYRIGCCAFTDTCYDRHDAAPMKKRTYVYLGEGKPTLANLITAIQEGKTFGTSGPLMLVALDGRVPGHVFTADGAERNLHVRAFAPGVDYTSRSQQPYLDRIEILRNGETWKSIDLGGQKSLEHEISETIQEQETAWYIIKVFGSGNRQVAISSPFYFRANGFKPPEPITANAHIQIIDAQTKQPLQGTIEAISYRKENSTVVFEQTVDKQGANLTLSPTFRLRGNAPGYNPNTYSLFFDTPELYRDLILPLQREDLLDPGYYRRIKEAIKNLKITIPLNKG
jgi:hypothetical protein